MPNDLRSAALDAVERGIEPVRARLNRIPGLDKVFHDCFVNTLETTVQACLLYTSQPGLEIPNSAPLSAANA